MSLPPMEIYAFEDEFQRAAETILRKNGVNDVSKQQDSPVKLDDGTTLTLKTPRAEVKFLNGGMAPKEHYFIASNNVRWLDFADGIAYVKIVTRRSSKDSSHAYLRGLCRYAMQQVQEISAVMKYHLIEKMIETSSTVSFEADKIHDVSALSFNLTLRIRNTWFPTS